MRKDLNVYRRILYIQLVQIALKRFNNITFCSIYQVAKQFCRRTDLLCGKIDV